MSEIISTRKAKAAHWRELLLEQATSGQAVPQFCLCHNISSDMFYYWRKKFRSKILAGTRQQGTTSHFIPVPLRDFKPGMPRVLLPNGVTIDLGDDLGATDVKKFLLKLCGIDLGGADAKS